MVHIWNLHEVSWLEDQLIEIWQEAFDDSEDIIRTFMREVGAFAKLVTCEKDGKIVSATYLLPISYVKDDNTTLDCYYLYAAATLHAYRGCGYFARILQFVNECISLPVLLVPASKGLVEYYRGQGFRLWLTEQDDAVAKFENTKAKPISKEEYCQFRKEVFHKSGNVVWGKEMMEYICTEHEKAGGIFAETYIDEARVVFMCIGNGNDWRILEMISHNKSLRIYPTVMVNKIIFEEGKGYFNLTMG